MPNLELYEVDVPIHRTDQQLHGLHVFTGQATSPSEALARAHQVYDAALAARKAGLANPGRQDDGWGAERGPRRLGAGLASGEGRPLDQPVQLDQHQQLRAVDTPRGRRSRPGNRRLPRATHPVQDEREPSVWPPPRAYTPRSDNAPCTSPHSRCR